MIEAPAEPVSLDWLTSSPAALHWVESAPVDGTSVIGTWRKPRGASRGAFPVRNDVPATDSGPYVVTQLGGWAASGNDGQVWHVNSLTRCTDAPGPHRDLAYGDGLVLCVRTTGDGDELVAISPVTGEIGVLHRAGFLASPRLRSGRLAWVQGGRDAGEVWVAHYEAGLLGTPMRVAGGPDESARQPRWDDVETLHFTSDWTGRRSLYRWRDGTTELVAPGKAAGGREVGCLSYGFLPDDRMAMIEWTGSLHRLVIVARGGLATAVELPYSSLKPSLAVLGDRVAVVGSSLTRSQEIALIRTDGSGQIEVVRAG